MMNPWGLLTVTLGFAAYRVGIRITEGRFAFPVKGALPWLGIFLALPALFYLVYYTGVLSNVLWLYRMRTLAGSELLASPAGFLAGWIQARWARYAGLTGFGERFLVPVVLGLILAVPHLKPLLRPLSRSSMQDCWSGEACLQSSSSTCGPASAATLVRQLGGSLSEATLAREAFTCSTGTEIWYLARALRSHGYSAEFDLVPPPDLQAPCISGVRLKAFGYSGHFVAIVDHQGDRWVIADPMQGLITNTLSGFSESYEFTGLELRVTQNKLR